MARQFNSSSITWNYNTLKRLGVGVYGVQFHDQPLGYGDVQVTAYGYGSEYCKVANWNPTDGVQVRCFSSSEVPVDTDFDVTILYSSNLG